MGMELAYRRIQIAQVSQHLRKLDALHHYGCFVQSWDGPSRVFAIIQNSRASNASRLPLVTVTVRVCQGLEDWLVHSTVFVVGCVAYWNPV
jgi:hypothetical protein